MSKKSDSDFMSGPDLVEFYPGDDAGLRVNVYNKENGVDTPVSLAGSEFMLLIKEDYRDSDTKSIIIVKTGLLANDPNAVGTLYFMLSNNDTSHLKPGKYFVVIKRKLADTICTVKRGKLQVLSPVACG